MTAADREVWIHRATGIRFTLEHDCATHGVTGRRRTVRIRHERDTLGVTDLIIRRRALEESFILDRSGDDGLMALAEAVGVVAERVRQPGQPHPSEFTTGPTGNGPAWGDDRLWESFDRAERLGGTSPVSVDHSLCAGEDCDRGVCSCPDALCAGFVEVACPHFEPLCDRCRSACRECRGDAQDDGGLLG